VHQDWLVVSGAAESLDEEDEESDDDVSPDDEDDDDDDALGVLVAAGVAAVFATVCAPIEPSKWITPQASTNVDSVAAMTVRRIRATRRARSARRARPTAARVDGWEVGMRPKLRALSQRLPSASWEIAGKCSGSPT
jgi:hypothetical protein